MIDLNLLPIAKGECKRQTCDISTLGSGNYPFEGDCLFFLGGSFFFSFFFFFKLFSFSFFSFEISLLNTYNLYL